jgi:hypothetical protein
MITANKNSRLILLISSLLIVVPMVIFPAQLGMNLTTGSFIYSALEIVYYGVILFLLRPRTTLLKLLEGAGLTFLYRIVLGTIFGILIALMYSIGLTAALTLGISRYLPAIILHVVVAPFAMKPFYDAISGDNAHARRPYPRSYQKPPAEKEEKLRPYLPRTEQKPALNAHPAQEPRFEMGPVHDMNGFERAVKYLGEHHAVLLATVVDREGLAMASFRRGDADPEEWAPLSLLFQHSNRSILKRIKEGKNPDRVDLAFGARKLTIMQTYNFNLLVLSNRDEDDLLGIRITQAAEIIRKYASERYGHLLPASPEEKYVSNT